MTENTAVLKRIVQLLICQDIAWSGGARGWAPEEVANLLENSRLDRRVQLAECLLNMIPTEPTEELNDGQLILGWATIGSIIETSLQLFLTLHHSAYCESEAFRKIKKKPHELMLKNLNDYFRGVVWSPQQIELWDEWLNDVRKYRNSIHAFADRDIGNYTLFCSSIRTLENFLVDLQSQHPPEPEYF